MGNAYELSLALFRVYPVRVYYPDSFAPGNQDEIIADVEAFGRRFPEDLKAFQRQYLNFCRLLEEAELFRQSEQGARPVPLAELREEQAELVDGYYDALDALIELYPQVPLAEFALDHPIAAEVRAFEQEAEIYVGHMGSVAHSLLFDVLRIFDDAHDPPVFTLHKLLSADLQEQLDQRALTFDELVELKLHLAGELELKAIFNPRFAPQRIGHIVNAVQGQMPGHISRFCALLKNEGLKLYVEDAIKQAKDVVIPQVMQWLEGELQRVLDLAPEIYNLSKGPRERESMKDLALDAGVISKGSLFRLRRGIEALIGVEAFSPDADDYAFRANQVAQVAQRVVDNVEEFAFGFDPMPIGDIALKWKKMESALSYSLGKTFAVVAAYQGAAEAAERELRPYLGMISFEAGGQSEFYAEWYAQLNRFLHFPSFAELVDALQVLADKSRDMYADQARVQQALDLVIDERVASAIRYKREDERKLPARNFTEVLAGLYCLAQFVTDMPKQLFHIEDYACVLLECDNHRGFTRLPRLGPEQAESLSGVATACRVYLDMSKSMEQDGRVVYARGLAERIDQRLEQKTFAATTEVYRFAADIDTVVRAEELVLAADGRTATGAALLHAGSEIAKRPADELAYLTLITDGIPTVGGTVAGEELDPLQYAVQMAGALPANTKLVLVALAPVDPMDKVRLQAYLGYVKRLCEAAPFGQAVVVCRRQEKRLSELVLGAQLKVRQIAAFAELYG